MSLHILTIFIWIFCLIINLINMYQGKEPSWAVLLCAIIAAILANINALICKMEKEKK